MHEVYISIDQIEDQITKGYQIISSTKAVASECIFACKHEVSFELLSLLFWLVEALTVNELVGKPKVNKGDAIQLLHFDWEGCRVTY